MNNNISISVITATWNCAKTLPDCLTSVLKQDYKNKAHVVIDGGSTDETISTIKKNIDQIAVFISERDSGIYDALNKGVKLATGDVIGFLHADDVYASNDVLSKVAKAFEDPTVSAVYGDLDYVSQSDSSKVIRRWRSKPFNKCDLAWGWMPPHPTLYVRREWYEQIGGFDANLRISADYFSILNLFMQPNFKAIYLPDVIVKMRLGGASNKSIKAVIQKSNEDWQILRRCKFSIYSAARAIVWKNLSKLGQFF